ncbi:MAG: hypothetical protein ABI659_04405, partial [Nitrosospira sp.]
AAFTAMVSIGCIGWIQSWKSVNLNLNPPVRRVECSICAVTAQLTGQGEGQVVQKVFTLNAKLK